MNLDRKYICGLFAAMAVASFSSCESLDHTQKQWADENETIFVGKLDSLEVRSGMNRVEIVGQTTYIRTAKTCEVVYDDKKLKFNMADIVGEDGLARMIVDNLEGGNYYFDVTTYDANGNKSLTTEVYGKVYGESDVLMQTPKRITEILPQPDGTIDLYWNDAEATYIEMEYEKEDGTIEKITIDGEEEYTSIESWKLGGAINIQAFVLKNEDDLDAIKLDPLSYNFPEKIQKAIPKFGSGSKMNLGPSSDWDLTEKFTMEMMARYDELRGGDQCLISNEGSGGCFIFRNNGTNLQFYINDGGWRLAQYAPLELNRWYHFAIVYDGAAKMHAIYVDGVEVARGSNNGMLEPSSDLQLGCSTKFPDRAMYGDVQHLSIWSDVRTAEEIAEDFKNGGVFDGTEEGLKAYWAMDVNYGTVVPDITGNYNATFEKVTWVDVD